MILVHEQDLCIIEEIPHFSTVISFEVGRGRGSEVGTREASCGEIRIEVPLDDVHPFVGGRVAGVRIVEEELIEFLDMFEPMNRYSEDSSAASRLWSKHSIKSLIRAIRTEKLSEPRQSSPFGEGLADDVRPLKS
jgi:hypothetical protein